MRAVAYWSDHPLVAVGRPDAHAVALAHAAGEQAARGEADLVPQLAVGRAVALVAHDERLAVAEALDGAAQALADGQLEQRDVARPAREREREGGGFAFDEHVGYRRRAAAALPALSANSRQGSSQTSGARADPARHVTESPQGRRHRRRRRRARRGRRLRRHAPPRHRPSRRTTAPPASRAQQQQAAPPGRPTSPRSPSKLGVSTARLQQAMQAARPSRRAPTPRAPIRPPRWPRRSACPRPRCGPRCRRPGPAGAAGAGPPGSRQQQRRRGPVGGMRLARGLTLALALLGPASAAHAATVGLADQQARVCRPSRPGARAALRAPHRPVGRGDLAAAGRRHVAGGRARRGHGAACRVRAPRDRPLPAAAVHDADRGPVRRRRPALRRALPAGADLHDLERGQSRQPARGRRPGGRRGVLRRSCAPRARAAPWSRATSSTRGPTGAGWSASCARARRRRGCGACTTTATSPTAVRRASTPCSPRSPERLWIEETGGLVALRNAAGRQTLHRRRGLRGERDRSRLRHRRAPTRGSGACTSTSGVRTRPTASTPGSCARTAARRPSYAALARDLAAQRALRWRATWSTRRAGRLVLRATCTRAPAPAAAG